MAQKKALKVIPTEADYVVQAHKISRAAYDMPVMQRRLIYLAMAQVRPTDDELPIVQMTVGDVVRALRLNDSALRYEEIRAAVRGMMERVIEVDEPDGWLLYHWVDTARYIKSRDSIVLKLSDELKAHVLQLRDTFAIISIADIARLQGRYALRLFELVMSNKGHVGKDGNKAGEWYTDLEFDHLRAMFKISPDEYKMTADLRRKVVDSPVREINEADLGLYLECDYSKYRRGKRLFGVRLKCKLISRNDLRPVSPATKAEEEDEALLAANAERFAVLLAEEKAQGEFPETRLGLSPEIIAHSHALTRLKAEVAALPPKDALLLRGSW